ncbi:uncharacterized protein LOC113788769 [Dermatophagoides pteronyssinus]|uniref:uncharacterized protein LOC113788769 n=1 Tax=Dermatophagoides pteronyssinus TaxID=6956 RepID=UPI003F6776AE
MNSLHLLILATIIIVGLMFMLILIWIISLLRKHFVRSKQMENTLDNNNFSYEQQQQQQRRRRQTSNGELYCNNRYSRQLSLKNMMDKSIHQLNNQIDDHHGNLNKIINQPFQIPRPKLIRSSIPDTITATPDYDMTDDDYVNINHNDMERPYSYIFPNNYSSNNNNNNNNNNNRNNSNYHYSTSSKF